MLAESIETLQSYNGFNVVVNIQEFNAAKSEIEKENLLIEWLKRS